jgi:hypothetical protein
VNFEWMTKDQRRKTKETALSTFALRLWSVRSALLPFLLLSCAPARATTTQPVSANPSSIISLTVNANGDTVCIPNNSSMAAHFPRAAIRGQTGHGWFEAPVRISSAAFSGGAWWLALPRAGLVQKAEGVPQNIAVVGQPARLSSRFIFTLEGDILRYDGSKVGRVPSLPSAVLELAKSTVLLVGKDLYTITETVQKLRQLENTNVSLLPNGEGFEVVAGVAVRQGNLTFKLERSQVSISSNNQPLYNIALSSNGSSLAVGGDTLAVAIGGAVAFYDSRTFAPLRTRACEVTR